LYIAGTLIVKKLAKKIADIKI